MSNDELKLKVESCASVEIREFKEFREFKEAVGLFLTAPP
jgi:hypothetical protein